MNNTEKLSDSCRKILFCTDFSENAGHAFRYAVDMASRCHECKLILLHVIPEPDAQFWKTYLYEVEGIDDKAMRDIDAKIDAGYRPFIPEGLEFQAEMVIGRDYISILEYASANDVDMIVMGRHGHTAFHDLLFGNVTEKVVRQANCPVLVVPPGKSG